MDKKTNINKCAGFSMIEMLVAIVLSSIVAIAVVQVFGQNKNSNVAHEDITRLQENGRYAIQLLTRELRSADYWGCAETFDDVTNNVVGLAFADATTDGVGVGGDEGNAVAGADGFPSQADTLQITGLRSAAAFPLASAHAPGDLSFSVNVNGLTGITPNEILVASDCEKAVLFQVTNDVDAALALNGVNQVATITHSDVPAAAFPTTFSNTQETLDDGDFAAVSTAIYRNFAVSRTFSIANDDADNDPATPAVPTLMLSIDGGAAQPLVPGIENMQVVYGEDIDNDSEADRFVAADNIADFDAVVSVRISLLVRSPDANNEFASAYTMEGITIDEDDVQAAANGRFHNRRVYSATIALRNRTT